MNGSEAPSYRYIYIHIGMRACLVPQPCKALASECERKRRRRRKKSAAASSTLGVSTSRLRRLLPHLFTFFHLKTDLLSIILTHGDPLPTES